VQFTPAAENIYPRPQRKEKLSEAGKKTVKKSAAGRPKTAAMHSVPAGQRRKIKKF